MNKKARKRIVLFRFTLCLFFCFSVCFVCMYEVRARPVIKDVASSQAENMAVNVIEKSIIKVLEENEFTYSSLVKIQKDENGKIASIETDIVKMNLVKSEISRVVSEEILELDSKEISIPIGTIIGTSILSGKGPKIKTEVTLSSNVSVSVDNKFISTGINQTLHEIVINIDAAIFVIMPRNNTSTQVNTNFCIAQTVIVGDVPETFADFQNKGETNE